MKRRYLSLREQFSPNKISMYIIQLMIGIAAAISIIGAVNETSGLKMPFHIVLFACTGILLLFSILFMNRFVANISILTIIAGSLSYLFILYQTEKLDEFRITVTVFARRFYVWLINFYMVGFSNNAKFESYLFLMICALICLPVFIFTIKKYTFALIFVGGFATFCIQWSFGFFAMDVYFSIFICTVVFGYCWHIYLKNRQIHEVAATDTPVKFFAYMLPACLIFFLIISRFPIPAKPIHWPWLNQRVNQVSSAVYGSFYYHNVGQYTINQTGFSNGESYLSGPIRINNTHVLSVQTDNPRLYLKGNGKNTYTGNSWKSTSAEDEISDKEFIDRILMGDSTSTDTDKDLNDSEKFETKNEENFKGNDKKSVWTEKSEADQDLEEYYLSYPIFTFRTILSEPAYIAQPSFDGDAYRALFISEFDKTLKQAKVNFQRLRTRTVFTPLKLYNIDTFNEETGETQFEDGAMLLENKMAEGFEYEIEYFDEDAFQLKEPILETSYTGFYQDMLNDFDIARAEVFTMPYNSYYSDENGLRRHRRTEPGGYYYIYLQTEDFIKKDELERLVSRAEDIQERYMALPDELPERVRELSEELTREEKTNYQKAKALERFLTTRYRYTMNVSYISPGEDFVDSFLFKLNEGYCTHFASAMAIMARCIGLPSRYVEGYVMPKDKDGDGTYHVTNAQAHAWTEIYFEGYGWCKFEPTADFFGTGSENDETGNADSLITDKDEYNAMMEQFKENENLSAADVEQPEPATSNIVDRDQEKPKKERTAAEKIVFSVLLAAAISGVVFCAGKLRKKSRQRKFSDVPEKAIKNMFLHYYKMLGLLRCRMGHGETMMQFALRVEHELEFGGKGFVEATRILEKICYSKDRDISEQDKEKVRQQYQELLFLFEKTHHKVVYGFLKDIIAEI